MPIVESSLAEATLSYWIVSQRYEALPPGPPREHFKALTVAPLLDQMKHKDQRRLVGSLLTRAS